MKNNKPGTSNHRHKKRFGQNFLCDQHIIGSIVHYIHPQADDQMVEIGPGEGALTQLLLPQVKRFTAIELDHSLIPKLQPMIDAQTGAKLIQADALEVDLVPWGKLIQPNKLRIIGNLPYNISTPLMFHLLTQAEVIQDMTFMLQLEVVKRICAQPKTKAYGRLTIMIQAMCEVEAGIEVPPESFNPPPKVWSQMVKLTPKTNPLSSTLYQGLKQVVTKAFMQRRKTLSNSLSSIISSTQMEALEINPKARAEDLSVDQFLTVTRWFQAQPAQENIK